MLQNYLCLELSDSDKDIARFSSVLPETRLFIHTALKIGSVLVHCRGGISRSPAIVVDFLSRETEMTAAEALDHVKSKRDCVEPRKGFLTVKKKNFCAQRGKMSVEIKLQRLHVCDEQCKMVYLYTGLGSFPMHENERYDEETGKCDKSGKVMDSSPSIASWLSSKEHYGLVGGGDIVIAQPKATVVFTYPLSKEHTFEVQGTADGITRGELVDFICKTYERIYKEEDEACPPVVWRNV